MPVSDSIMQNVADMLHLYYLPQIGNKRINLLLETFGSASNALKQNADSWRKLKIPEVSITSRFNDEITSKVTETLKWLEHPLHHILLIGDNDYPEQFEVLEDKPQVLFAVGDVSILSNVLQIAIVGGRRATITGLDNANDFAQKLARLNFVITSGLALGIDSASHQGALSVDGKTIAVLGTGFPRIYPNQNQDLARDIVRGGGVLISEFALNTAPMRENFPKRNRLISALSLGTLVVEADLKSGSLITARYAIEQGKNVWAIAGTLKNLSARGCHKLIRSGEALLVENIEQIIETLTDDFAVIKQQLVDDSFADDADDNKESAHPILDVLRSSSLSAEDISMHLKISFPEVLAKLTDLELAGSVTNAGGIYSLRTVRTN